jgi:hypothetical protein
MLRAISLALMLSAAAVTASQPAADAGVRSAVTVMRAINTAENAVRHESGKYVLLADLLEHRAMSRVRTDIVVNGAAITHQGRTLRVVLSGDALQYHAMVVPAETCGTAIFSDERGLIYTGKVLDC